MIPFCRGFLVLARCFLRAVRLAGPEKSIPIADCWLSHAVLVPLGARFQRSVLVDTLRWNMDSMGVASLQATVNRYFAPRRSGTPTLARRLRSAGRACATTLMVAIVLTLFLNMTLVLPFVRYLIELGRGNGWRGTTRKGGEPQICMLFVIRIATFALACEAAGGLLWLWARYVPLVPLPALGAAANLNNVLLSVALCLLVCWSRVWVGLLLWAMLAMELALISWVPAPGWLNWSCEQSIAVVVALLTGGATLHSMGVKLGQAGFFIMKVFEAGHGMK